MAPDAVLARHSYGGMVVAGAADRPAARVAHPVFLDAFVPADGQSLFAPLRPERRDLFLRRVREQGDARRVPPPPQAFGIAGETRRWRSPPV